MTVVAGVMALLGATPVMAQKEISHYTCGMHPSVHVSVKEYKNGSTQCPICGMNLIPVYKKEKAKTGEENAANVLSRVEIQEGQLKLAGVATESVARRHLVSEIRTVGTVAFDPQLAVAQDEFLGALKTFHKAQEGGIAEIVARTQALYEASRRKLRLLGLSETQIRELEEKGEVQTNLILPEDKMWIYGDVYEYEISLVHQGDQVKVTTLAAPGEEFSGEVASINPVLDKKTRSVRFRALIDNPKHLLKPEMYVDVYILSHYMAADGEHATLSIPKAALLDTGRRRIVWVAKDNGMFEGRKVEVGPLVADAQDKDQKYYPVLSGLKEGERVVTKGNFLIDSQSQITGVAASAYGGSLGSDNKEEAPAHVPGHVH